MRKIYLHPCIIGFFCYFAILFFWRKADPSGVLFYQGLALAILVSFVQIFVQKMIQPGSSAVKDALITLLVCYSFMFTIPTTVDRSYTVEMIIELAQHPDGLTSSQIKGLFSKNFTMEGSVEKRFSEQIATGSLVKNDNRYQLTPFGIFLADCFLWVQRLFSIHSAKLDSR